MINNKFYERYEFSAEHLQFLQEQHPVDSVIESPSGTKGRIIAYTHNGFLVNVALQGGVNKEVTFKQIGRYKVIGRYRR